MNDLVQRLRYNATPELVMEAADRIEELETALQIIAETAKYLGAGRGVVGDLEIMKIARATLAGEQK